MSTVVDVSTTNIKDNINKLYGLGYRRKEVMSMLKDIEQKVIDDRLVRGMSDNKVEAKGISINHKEYIAFQCQECGVASVFPKERADGNRCIECGGYLLPAGLARVHKKEAVTLEDKDRSYEILLKNGKRVFHTGTIMFFKENETVILGRTKTMYINSNEILYVKDIVQE